MKTSYNDTCFWNYFHKGASVNEEVSIECFESSACDRETFKRVNSIRIVSKTILLYFASVTIDYHSFLGGPWWIFMVYDTS